MNTLKNNGTQHVLEPKTMEIIQRTARLIRWRMGREVPESDLIALGVLGYLESQRRHNAEQAHVTSFSYSRVYGAMVDGVRRWSHKRRTLHAYSRRTKAQRALDASDPAQTHDAHKSVTPQPDLRQFSNTASDVLVNHRSESETFILVDGRNPEDMLERLQRDHQLHRVFTMLSSDDRKLLEQSFFADMTLEEIGASNGRSRSWACRCHQRALGALKSLLCEHAPELVKDILQAN